MSVRIVYCATWATTARKAASFAALIRDRLHTTVEMEKGRRGQFEILVDGRPVVSRQGGLVARLVGRPWPEGEEVLTAVRKALPVAQ